MLESRRHVYYDGIMVDSILGLLIFIFLGDWVGRNDYKLLLCLRLYLIINMSFWACPRFDSRSLQLHVVEVCSTALLESEHEFFVLQLSWVNLSRNLLLAYQSFGVVYGDLSTSPLYVYRSTFIGKLQNHENEDSILGAFSLIFWTITLIPLLKYVFIILDADDNGEGERYKVLFLIFVRIGGV